MISERLPGELQDAVTLTTVSGYRLDPNSAALLTSLLHKDLARNADFLSLRLTAPVRGGKGGFGSQLRAAGGRMSSRKKRAQGENNTSNRNLDGRRLRTVNEAKALAEYLAVKPEMDKKEKEERRKRWEAVVESAERREEEIKSGSGKARIDGKWLEEKEEAEFKTRDAIAAAMQAGLLRDDARKLIEVDSESESESEAEARMDDEDGRQLSSSSKDTTPPLAGEVTAKQAPRKIYGWDEDDEDVSSSEDEKS